MSMTWMKLPFGRTEKSDDDSKPTISKRHWEEIARVINWNADRNLIVATAAEMTAMAASPIKAGLRIDQIAYKKDNGQLYRWSGSAWVQP